MTPERLDHLRREFPEGVVADLVRALDESIASDAESIAMYRRVRDDRDSLRSRITALQAVFEEALEGWRSQQATPDEGSIEAVRAKWTEIVSTPKG